MQTLHITVSLLALVLNVDQIICFGNGYAGRHLLQLVSDLRRPGIRRERASMNDLADSRIDLIDAATEEEPKRSIGIVLSDDTSLPESSGVYDANVAWPRWEKLVWTYGR